MVEGRTTQDVLELSFRRPDGQLRDARATVHRAVDTDGVVLVEGILEDTTERKALERQLEEAATHDPLTGLLNRRALLAQLDREDRRRRRYQEPMAVLLLDLDLFKRVNDALGHLVGDQVLGALPRC